jgi:glycerol-3-phosphate acyltransferase PlsY
MSSLPALFIPLAFLAGSIPTGLLIGRTKGIDIRQHGSKNIGATNVGRVLGRKYFFLCFAIDFSKGLIPPLLCGYVLGTLGTLEIPTQSALIWLGTMVATVLGNVFSPWLKFKGGKGVATSIGALVGVFPPLAVPGMLGFAGFYTALKLSGYISAGSLTSCVVVPLSTVIMFVLADVFGNVTSWTVGLPFMVSATCMGALVIWTHRANIARLRNGTEPKATRRIAASTLPISPST